MALPLKLQDHAVFESFLPAGNETLVAYLSSLATSAGEPGCWLFGAKATGKSHLLQAVCERVGDRAQYVPIAQFSAAGAAILDGLGNRPFVCLDDIDQIAGNEEWELALFQLFNVAADQRHTVICAAQVAPRECGFRLADLASRCARLATFQVAALGEAERIDALRLRARHRGLELPDETASFLLSRSRRDMQSLYELLDRLDSESLRAKRRLTVPFVREVLGLSQADSA
jgi:DnaA family protein